MKPYFADSSLHLNGLTGLTGILQVCVPKREPGTGNAALERQYSGMKEKMNAETVLLSKV